MKLLMALLPFVTMGLDSPQPKKPDFRPLQLVFFTEPKAPIALTDTATDKLQTEHLKFLEGLYNDRKALLVGPFLDAGKRRGLVLLDCKDADEAKAILRKDAHIASGVMDMEVLTWFCDASVPTKGPKFLDLEPLWFGILERPKDAPTFTPEELEKIQAGHMANINAMAKSGDLVFAGPTDGKTDIRGFFVFRMKDQEAIEKLCAKDPAIQKGRLKLSLYRWLTPKGSF